MNEYITSPAFASTSIQLPVQYTPLGRTTLLPDGLTAAEITFPGFHPSFRIHTLNRIPSFPTNPLLQVISADYGRHEVRIARLARGGATSTLWPDRFLRRSAMGRFYWTASCSEAATFPTVQAAIDALVTMIPSQRRVRQNAATNTEVNTLRAENARLRSRLSKIEPVRNQLKDIRATVDAQQRRLGDLAGVLELEGY